MIEEKTDLTIEEVLPFRDTRDKAWINIDGIHDLEIIQQTGTHFGLHPLNLEDIATTGQRPKMEAYDDYLYLVVPMIAFDEKKDRVHMEQVSIVFGKHWVLSFQEEPGDVFENVRNRLRSGKGRIRGWGTDYLAYALLDIVIDHYFLVLETLGERIEELENQILSETPDLEMQKKIRDLRHELILVRRAVWPIRELVNGLERNESSLVGREVRPFLRDTYDHTIQVIDIVESLRDVLSGLMDLYMSSLSNRMNEVMKVLTIIGTIFIPLTFVAGIYGMNFDHMPELHWRWGYPLAMGVMVAIAGALVLFFQRRGWF